MTALAAASAELHVSDKVQLPLVIRSEFGLDASCAFERCG
jgi:hypothetical protein